MNLITKVFQQNYTLTECNPLYPILMRLWNGRWITFGEKLKIPCVRPMSIYEKTRQEMRPQHLIGLKEMGLFTRDDLQRSSRARARRHSRTIIAWTVVYLGSQDQNFHEHYFHFNIPYRQLGFSWAASKVFETVEKDTLLLLWTAREIAITIVTQTLLGTMLRFFIKLFFIIKLEQQGSCTAVEPVLRV